MPVNGHALSCLGASSPVLLEARMLHPPSSSSADRQRYGCFNIADRRPAEGSEETDGVD